MNGRATRTRSMSRTGNTTSPRSNAIFGTIDDQYPDLRGGHDTGYLAIRVSVRGRDKHGMPASPLHPRRTRLEDHLIDAWPVAGPASRVVPKRDEFSRRWENSHGGRRS